MKNLIKVLFVAVLTASFSFANAQGDSKMEKKSETKTTKTTDKKGKKTTTKKKKTEEKTETKSK